MVHSRHRGHGIGFGHPTSGESIMTIDVACHTLTNWLNWSHGRGNVTCSDGMRRGGAAERNTPMYYFGESKYLPVLAQDEATPNILPRWAERRYVSGHVDLTVLVSDSRAAVTVNVASLRFVFWEGSSVVRYQGPVSFIQNIEAAAASCLHVKCES